MNFYSVLSSTNAKQFVLSIKNTVMGTGEPNHSVLALSRFAWRLSLSCSGYRKDGLCDVLSFAITTIRKKTGGQTLVTLELKTWLLSEGSFFEIKMRTESVSNISTLVRDKGGVERSLGHFLSAEKKTFLLTSSLWNDF